MALNRGKQSREAEQNPKRRLSSDRSLQLDCVKLELLVIADQHAAVNTFPGLVAAEGGSDNWGEVVTR